MPGWDDDSPELEANLAEAQRLATEHALARRRLTLANIKGWHRATMKGLEICEVAAWAHREWVRLRPRPDGDYAAAAEAAMRGDHLPMTAYVINELLTRAKQAKR